MVGGWHRFGLGPGSPAGRRWCASGHIPDADDRIHGYRAADCLFTKIAAGILTAAIVIDKRCLASRLSAVPLHIYNIPSIRKGVNPTYRTFAIAIHTKKAPHCISSNKMLYGRWQDRTADFHDVRKTLIISFIISNCNALLAALCFNLTPLNILCKRYICMP